MNNTLLRARRRASRRHATSDRRTGWLQLVEEAIFYFGVTLLPLLVVIVLYQWGVIA
jgi:hypothetical protein